MLILFVCTGNTCRSPMAELYLASRLKAAGLAWVEVASAGVGAVPGMPISHPAELVMNGLGIDASRFRSRRLTAELIAAADVAAVMTESHRRDVCFLVPEAAKKTRLLLEFAGDPVPVPDPFGGSLKQYAAVFSRMRPALDALADAIIAEERQN